MAYITLRVHNTTRNFQDGGRYFSRREITALAAGPGNMAVYRHILVIPPDVEVLPPKNEKPPTAKTLPPYCITAEKIPSYFGSCRFRQKSTVYSRYRQKVPPTLNTVKRVPLTLDTAQNVPPTLDLSLIHI